MKREIKFRAWDLNEDEYIPWERLIQVRYNQDFYKTKDPSAPILSALTDKYIILEQFTGLWDSDNKEVYEGDVIENDDGEKGIIGYELGEFYCTLDFGTDLYKGLYRHGKVIGTVHDAEYKELAK